MAGIVRMTHPRIRDRHVPFKQVARMQQNGWTVADDDKPKRKRRSQSDDSEPPEKDSGGSSLPENEQES